MHSSTKPAWLQADRRQINVISFGCTPLLHIRSKCFRASLPWLCKAHPPSVAFQETTFRNGILLNTLKASSMLPHFANRFQSSYSPKIHQTPDNVKWSANEHRESTIGAEQRSLGQALNRCNELNVALGLTELQDSAYFITSSIMRHNSRKKIWNFLAVPELLSMH